MTEWYNFEDEIPVNNDNFLCRYIYEDVIRYNVFQWNGKRFTFAGFECQDPTHWCAISEPKDL